MLFPNFDVPSVAQKCGCNLERSRMSLSHPDRREQGFLHFHSRFITGGAAAPARRPGWLPGGTVESASESIAGQAQMQLSGLWRV
jgi:hypothetical protein